MALHPTEEATLRAFVVAAKRERMIALLGNAKRRRRALDTLNHFADWDPRYAHSVGSPANLVAVLRQAGAPEECHVISDHSKLDGRDMRLEEAVSAAEAFSFASVLCCVPGRLALYFDEVFAPRRRLLLWRSAAVQ